ncbi:4356_t:CDS:2 [Dentiscutata erythropus]|uniref:4356_t:CDS:1 n=1 Tax=Dentiscutata erythropus TaxID=1348616 RepID=A0A9N9AWS8_9GLOM|nr:4356_t:CDS:2 [Dentiscutata erythropus]
MLNHVAKSSRWTRNIFINHSMRQFSISRTNRFLNIIESVRRKEHRNDSNVDTSKNADTWLIRNARAIRNVEEFMRKEKPAESFTVIPRNTVSGLKAPYWIDDLINKSKPLYPKDPSETFIIPKRELISKRMADSYIEQFIPFKSDPDLLEDYISSEGKIFRDLDILAKTIAFKHCENEHAVSLPLAIVTASVDRLDLIKPIPIADIRLSGHVTYVGYSSVEVLIKMESLHEGVLKNIEPKPEVNRDALSEMCQTILNARFTMVARDPFTRKSAQVNSLQLEDDHQKRLFHLGEEQRARSKVESASSLNKVPPTEEEKELIHELFLEHKNCAEKQNNFVWMDNTTMESVTLMTPQLAFSTACVFLRSRPIFLALDEISFRKSVPIGSILKMSSQIVCSPGPPHKRFQIAVTADVIDIENEKRETTNVFHFTFTSNNLVDARRVIPKTYDEALKYIEGRRRRNVGLKLRKLYIESINNSF